MRLEPWIDLPRWRYFWRSAKCLSTFRLRRYHPIRFLGGRRFVRRSRLCEPASWRLLLAKFPFWTNPSRRSCRIYCEGTKGRFPPNRWESLFHRFGRAARCWIRGKTSRRTPSVCRCRKIRQRAVVRTDYNRARVRAKFLSRKNPSIRPRWRTWCWPLRSDDRRREIPRPECWEWRVRKPPLCTIRPSSRARGTITRPARSSGRSKTIRPGRSRPAARTAFRVSTRR